jgi:hypothetical protein
VLGYRHDAIELAFLNDLTVGLGPNGTDPFERGGVHEAAGAPLFTSDINVP